MTKQLTFLLEILFSHLFNFLLPRNVSNYIFILFSARNLTDQWDSEWVLDAIVFLSSGIERGEVSFPWYNLFFCNTLLPLKSISTPDPTHSSLLFNFCYKMWSQVFLQLNMNHIWIFPWKHGFGSVLLWQPATNESLEGWPNESHHLQLFL